jgi:hypothetical protein
MPLPRRKTPRHNARGVPGMWALSFKGGFLDGKSFFYPDLPNRFGCKESGAQEFYAPQEVDDKGRKALMVLTEDEG